MCLGACYWARVKEIHFCADKEDASYNGFDDSFIYDEIAKPHGDRYIHTLFHPIPERLEPFKVWNTYNKKVKY
jgi:guanine deaminase